MFCFIYGQSTTHISIHSNEKTVIKKNNGINDHYIVSAKQVRIRDIEKITGRKLTLKQKIAFKIYQWKLIKEAKKINKDRTSKRSTAALVLSILSLASIILFPLSVLLAVISIILASRSIKENYEDKRAKTAMTLSILALGIVIVGLLAYGVLFSDGAFKIFIIN
jgi:predicted nucleic acid-binding Zn ribbon protein